MCEISDVSVTNCPHIQGDAVPETSDNFHILTQLSAEKILVQK